MCKTKRKKVKKKMRKSWNHRRIKLSNFEEKLKFYEKKQYNNEKTTEWNVN